MEYYRDHDIILNRIPNNPYRAYNKFDFSFYMDFQFTDNKPRIPLVMFKRLPHGQASLKYERRSRNVMLGALGGGFGSIELKYVGEQGESYIDSLSVYSHIVHLWKANLPRRVHITPKMKKATIERVEKIEKAKQRIARRGIPFMGKERFEYGVYADTFEDGFKIVFEDVFGIPFEGHGHDVNANTGCIANNDIQIKFVLVERYLEYLEMLIRECKRRGLASGTY